MKWSKRKNLLGMIALLVISFSSCYKDLGNYNIDMPITPQISGLDTLYQAVVGDSLIIEPRFEGVDAKDLHLHWRLLVPEALRPELNEFEGPSLRIVFGLQARRYGARLTVTNTLNGMKYFHNFNIQGITEFSRGSLVLSVENGVSKLSFIKPDSTVQPNIYEAINHEQLPTSPQNVHYLTNFNTGQTPLGYWIIGKNDGVRVNVNNLKKEDVKAGTLRDNFFLAPTSLRVDNLQVNRQGVLMGVINGKFYGGTTQTWDQADTYGMFGAYADGNYEMGPEFIMTYINGNYVIIGFEKNRKQFLRINIYGNPTYFGTEYAVVNEEIFNPKQLNMDLVKIVQVNNTDTYAYMKDASGTIHELKFNVNFLGPFIFTAGHKRPFIRPEWIGPDTKMLATQNGNIYVAYENKVYRYNPISQQVQVMTANLGSSEVSMLKLEDDGNTLIVGAGTSIYYLAIQVGRNGDLIGKIDGIPGEPVDMTWRK